MSSSKASSIYIVKMYFVDKLFKKKNLQIEKHEQCFMSEISTSQLTNISFLSSHTFPLLVSECCSSKASRDHEVDDNFDYVSGFDILRSGMSDDRFEIQLDEGN